MTDVECARRKALAVELLKGKEDFNIYPLVAFTEAYIESDEWVPTDFKAEVMAESYHQIAERFTALAGGIYSAISRSDRMDMARDCLLIAARLFSRPIDE